MEHCIELKTDEFDFINNELQTNESRLFRKTFIVMVWKSLKSWRTGEGEKLYKDYYCICYQTASEERFQEIYANEEERDKRYEEIKRCLA